jgi:predicted porin
VTLFGGADLGYRSVTSGDNKFSGMSQDGLYSSRFGVMGTEDLGGGLKAGFHFEGGMAPDVGTSSKFDFQRKSTIGLSGGFGEVRVGRDYTPMFTIAGIADPFGTNGVGSAYNVANGVTVTPGTGNAANDAYIAKVLAAGSSFATAQAASVAGAGAAKLADGITIADPNAVRANNSVAYYSPNFNGFSAGLMYGFGSENTSLAKKANSMTSLKLAYANGPLTVAYGNQTTKGGAAGANAAIAAGTNAILYPAISAGALVATDSQKYRTNFFAGSYDLGVAKLSAGYKTDKVDFGGAQVSATLKSTILGVSAPFGATTLKASYVSRKDGGQKVGNQFAVGAVHDLSKRTSVYGTYSALKNQAGYGNSVGSAAASDFTGVKSKGFEAGIKHTF